MTSLGQRARGWLRPLAYLGQNGLTVAGTALTTSAAFIMIVFWTAELLRDRPAHPYLGILLFLILPGVFVLGLLLIPIGILRQRRRLRARGELPSVYPAVDLRLDYVAKGAALVGAATVVNVAILGTASYKGVEYMDSTQFCGLTCHTVMSPQYTTYVDSPHARVGCVECHIGPGAPWFVRSKVSGARQVLAVALGDYSRPIPSPVEELRPARETCEQCHWPERFVGDRVVVRTRYADDEQNTPATSVLMLKVGGHGRGGATGIHGRHVGADVNITYTSTDGRREVIPRVVVARAGGATDEYVSAETTPAAGAGGRGEQRRMDCMDCHNRPTHVFELPERAVDRSLAEGRISPRLPYIKKMAVEALRTDYPDRETAFRQIAERLAGYYRGTHPAVFQERRAAIEAAAVEVQAIYGRNVFPDMKVTWGTYPNHIGHEDFLGCFRCHDDSHKRRDGATITQDCAACHTLLAQDERDPKILADLGLK
jgi:hypothetical protein